VWWYHACLTIFCSLLNVEAATFYRLKTDITSGNGSSRRTNRQCILDCPNTSADNPTRGAWLDETPVRTQFPPTFRHVAYTAEYRHVRGSFLLPRDAIASAMHPPVMCVCVCVCVCVSLASWRTASKYLNTPSNFFTVYRPENATIFVFFSVEQSSETSSELTSSSSSSYLFLSWTLSSCCVPQRLNLFHNFLSFSLDTENALHV